MLFPKSVRYSRGRLATRFRNGGTRKYGRRQAVELASLSVRCSRRGEEWHWVCSVQRWICEVRLARLRCVFALDAKRLNFGLSRTFLALAKMTNENCIRWMFNFALM